MSIREFVGIFELNGFESRVNHTIGQIMINLEDKARAHHNFIEGWEVMEDELRFVLMLRGDPEACELFVNDVETELGTVLRNQFGISINKLVVSRVTDVTPPPDDLTNLRLDIKKIQNFQRIFYFLQNETNAQKFRNLLLEIGQMVENEYSDTLNELALYDKEYDTGALKLTPLGYGVQKFVSDIIATHQMLNHILQVDCTFPLLFLLESLEEKRSESKTLELSILLLQNEPEIIEEALHFLKAENFIQLTSNNGLIASDIGTTTLKQFMSLVNMITEEQKAHNVISKAFESIDERVKYVIKRSGTVEAFTFGKILESLIRGGIEYDTSLTTVDALSDLFGYNDVVGANEVVASIKRKLNEHDLTHERAERYNFYVNTHTYLSWNDNGRIVPFDHSRLEKVLISRWFSLPNYTFSGSVINGLASKIYDAIRSFHAVIIPYMSDNSEDLPIELPPDFVCQIIDYIVLKAIPVLEHIPRKSKTSSINESIYQLTYEDDLIWKTLKPIIIEGLTTGLVALKRSHELFLGVLLRTSVQSFRKGAYKILSNSLMLLNAYPGLGFSSCATLLQVQIRKLLVNPPDHIKQRLGILDHLNLLKSLDELARRSMQVSMIQERNLNMKRIDIENVIRFGINLSQKLLDILES